MKVALVGKMRSGKDTVGRYIYDNDPHGWQNQLAFGDEIKRIAKAYFPHIVSKGKPRKLYQHIGQEFRKIDPEVWVKALDRSLLDLMGRGESNFVVTDVRQMNEYHYLKKQGFTIVKVETAEELRMERLRKSGDEYEEADLFHETEIAVECIPYDYLVSNNTTLEDLYTQVEFIIKEEQQ